MKSNVCMVEGPLLFHFLDKMILPAIVLAFEIKMLMTLFFQIILLFSKSSMHVRRAHGAPKKTA